MPSEDALRSLYTGYMDPLAQYTVSLANARRNAVGIKGRVMDYGCGQGAFGAVLDTVDFDLYQNGDVIPDGPWDWITMWGVLEHLTNPSVTMGALHRRLEGRIALTTVSIETPIPYRHKPPEHTLYFTKASIEALADRSGFKVIEYRPYTMVQDSDVYLDTLLRTMPDEYQAMVSHSMPKYVEIRTNEVFVVLEKV